MRIANQNRNKQKVKIKKEKKKKKEEVNRCDYIFCSNFLFDA